MTKESVTIIRVQVQPNAGENKVMHIDSGVWHLKIAAPPVKGKANRELVKFLSDILGIKKGDVVIEKGATNRRKTIAVRGLAPEQITARLGKLCKDKQRPLFEGE